MTLDLDDIEQKLNTRMVLTKNSIDENEYDEINRKHITPYDVNAPYGDPIHKQTMYE